MYASQFGDFTKNMFDFFFQKIKGSPLPLYILSYNIEVAINKGW